MVSCATSPKSVHFNIAGTLKWLPDDGEYGEWEAVQVVKCVIGSFTLTLLGTPLADGCLADVCAAVLHMIEQSLGWLCFGIDHSGALLLLPLQSIRMLKFCG